ncbi:vacuolar protein-sorting-associated protein 33 homolog [Salvia miltiorrhiza]|uniref:vacuolar protein-sorting-associated protein 33 homolog n=1 Tax=Salvia miltiorrhiza TaxID=226208 RepID=UPI0025AC3A86|nr:vacuolar protein-sorting-associated protein 33 homolog [Salvia miltiorrhiza]
MSQIPNLENAPINLTEIRIRAQTELLNILRDIKGDKCLVIDPKLSGALSLLVHSSELKENGAELRHLTAEPVQTERTKVVFLVRAQPDLMRFICSTIHNDTSKGLHREYYLYFVPRRLVSCENVLAEEKVRELLNIGEFPLYMLPLDEDVLSFELDLTEKECLVEGDETAFWNIAKAIHNLEFTCGVIPNVRAKGKGAARVADILTRMQTEEPVNAANMGIPLPEINTLILLDREVDMITPMLTQLTYEGLIDEFLGVKNGAVELDASIMGAQQEGKKTKVPLNSSDKLFKETRDLNFEVVVQVLRQKATSMKQDYTEISTTTQTVSELKDFVKKLNSLPEMTRHINLAQHLTTFTSKSVFAERLDMEQTLVEAQSYDICFDYIEELLCKQEPLEKVLRLLILFSVTNSGLPKKHFDYLRRELLISYGPEHINTLDSLEKAGLLRKQDSRSNWLTIKRALQLIIEDTDTTNPNDISYVFSGYAPLSIRLVQQAIRSGWRSLEEILKLLPGPHLETKRGGFSSIPSYDTLPGSLNSSEKLANGRRALVLVVFVGGVTFAEISALRFLSSQEGMAYDLILGITKVVNGRTLIETFISDWDK